MEKQYEATSPQIKNSATVLADAQVLIHGARVC